MGARCGPVVPVPAGHPCNWREKLTRGGSNSRSGGVKPQLAGVVAPANRALRPPLASLRRAPTRTPGASGVLAVVWAVGGAETLPCPLRALPWRQRRSGGGRTAQAAGEAPWRWEKAADDGGSNSLAEGERASPAGEVRSRRGTLLPPTALFSRHQPSAGPTAHKQKRRALTLLSSATPVGAALGRNVSARREREAGRAAVRRPRCEERSRAADYAASSPSVPRYSAMTLGSLSRSRPVPVYASLP